MGKWEIFLEWAEPGLEAFDRPDIAHLRQTYKAKRNFMALLKQRNW